MIEGQMRFMGTQPDMPMVDHAIVDVSVRRSDAGIDFVGPGIMQTCPEPEVLDTAHRILRRILLDETSNGILLHAASARIGGKHFAFIGEKGAGKTTLSLFAMAAGHKVLGDEHIFIEGTRAITRPRTLRVKESSAGLLPALAGQLDASPFLVNWNGQKIYAVEPRTAQGKWELCPYSIDHMVLLQPNHGGGSHAQPIGANDLFPVAMAQSFLPSENHGRVLSDLWNAVQGAATWSLALGDLGEAARELENIARMP